MVGYIYCIDAATTATTLANDNNNNVPLLPAADRTRLKGQSFVRPERWEMKFYLHDLCVVCALVF